MIRNRLQCCREGRSAFTGGATQTEGVVVLTSLLRSCTQWRDRGWWVLGNGRGMPYCCAYCEVLEGRGHWPVQCCPFSSACDGVQRELVSLSQTLVGFYPSHHQTCSLLPAAPNRKWIEGEERSTLATCSDLNPSGLDCRISTLSAS